MIQSRTIGYLVCALGLGAMILGPASAQAEGITVSGSYDVVTRAVDIADLNLALAADQHLLRHRLSLAARHVCLDVMGHAASDSDSMLTCYQAAFSEAWNSAQARIWLASARSPSKLALYKPQPPP